MKLLVALTLALAFGLPTASATTVTGPVGGLDPATIPCSTTSLEITSPTRNPFDDYQPSTTSPTYSIARVPGIDLQTREGWQMAQSPQLIDVLPPSHSLTDLPVGVYLVTEEGTSNSFYITLPTASADGTSWQCDVRIEPKHPVPPGTSVPSFPSDEALGVQRIPTSESSQRDEVLGIRHLPLTGASIFGLLLLGVLFFGSGLLLIRSRRE